MPIPSPLDRVDWTPTETAYLIERVKQGVVARIIAKELNNQYHGGRPVRTTKAVQMKRMNEGLVGRFHQDAELPPAPVIPELPEPPTVTPRDPIEVERERKTRLANLREEREAILAIAGERSLRAKLEALVQETARTFDPPPPYVPRKPKGAKTSAETVVQMFSDWHAGENVSGEAMRGFNEYNDTVFRERVSTVVSSHLAIKDRLEAGGAYQFERLIISANGDMVSGTIHELEKHSDYDNVVWAVYSCGMVLAEAIRDLAAVYPSVEVFCTSGNHGRLPDARRIQQKEPTRSWDTLVYLFAREHLRHLKTVQFFIPNSYAVAWDIYGWRWLQTHGHDVKSWNSIPWYGLNRLIGNMNALESGRGAPVHYWAFGHFHNASSLPHASGESFVNGSLIGSNEFALNALGKVDRPTQWMLQVHPEHGVTGRWPLFAAKPIAEPAR